MKTKVESMTSSPDEKKETCIAGCNILTPIRQIENGCIQIKNGRISDLGKSTGISKATITYTFNNCYAVPGFIDIHFHGAMGNNFNEGDSESLIKALYAHLKNGTTSCLPTLMTATFNETIAAIKRITEIKKKAFNIPEILGINLEGPHISEEKRGVHDRDSIRVINFEEISEYIKTSEDSIRIVTIAPEKEGALSLIRLITEKGIIASAGHTNANYEEMMSAISEGVKLATHLFNAMRGILQREPGAAGALLLSDDVSAEIIADGEHIHPALLKLVSRTKGPGRIIVVTDASKEYGIKTSASRTKSGTLMGGTMPLYGGIKQLMIHCDMKLNEALKSVTINPARLLGVEKRLGYIGKGADADIVILDKKLDIESVFLKGIKVI